MSISTCAVSGYIYDPFGVALTNQTVSFVPRDWVAGTDGIVVPQTKTFTTNGSGLLSSVPLVPGIYKVVFADPNIAGRTQFTISVPNTATANIQDIADFTGQIRQAGFLDGTAGSPVWTFVNDTNTGIYRPSDDTLGFSTGGVSRMTLSSAGATLAGLLTGTAVTQTEKDTTAGRLLKVGDFGLGGATVGLSGTDSIESRALPTGTYVYLASIATGGPETAAWQHTLQVSYNNTTGVRHYVSMRSTTSASLVKVWYGVGVGTNAIIWSTIPVGAFLLGTVSQSGGVPTGAIIERGSNANGEYVRFADGTQICTAQVVASASADVTWTFPAGFAVSPACSCSPRSGGVRIGVIGTGTLGSSITFGCYDNNGTRQSNTCNLIAIGRWY